MDFCDIECFALDTNRGHSVILKLHQSIASDSFIDYEEYSILNSFVDYEDYSISSKGFLPTVVDIMVI